ncbi:MAG: hypothetical protein E6J85_18830, partial [Deltaproteobacteria bacterium]
MAKGAGDAQRLDAARAIRRRLDAHHGVEIEEREGRRRRLQIDLSRLDVRDERCRQRIGVDFETNREGRRRIDRRDGFVELNRVGPEGLVSEGIGAEDLLTIVESLVGGRLVRIDRRWCRRRRRRRGRRADVVVLARG